jgi:hypothetical protein
MSLIEFSQALYDSDIGSGIRESLFLFPIIEGSHLLSLAFSVGLIVFTDLRLVGLFLRDVPASQILRQLRPWILGGFAVQFVTGLLLFWTEAIKVVELPIFWLKLLVIFLAGLNVLWFEFKWVRRVGEWDTQLAPPKSVRVAGWASLGFWIVVVTSGRLIPYLQYTTPH